MGQWFTFIANGRVHSPPNVTIWATFHKLKFFSCFLQAPSGNSSTINNRFGSATLLLCKEPAPTTTTIPPTHRPFVVFWRVRGRNKVYLHANIKISCFQRGTATTTNFCVVCKLNRRVHFALRCKLPKPRIFRLPTSQGGKIITQGCIVEVNYFNSR